MAADSRLPDGLEENRSRTSGRLDILGSILDTTAMNLPPWKIEHRIAVPFTVLFVVAILATAFVSQSLISRTLETRLREQVERASQVMAQSNFALNRPILEQVKQIIDADIVTYTGEGDVLATTLDEVEDADLLARIRSAESAREALASETGLVLTTFEHNTLPYTVAYRPIPSQDDTVIAFVVDTTDVSAARATIARTLTVIGLAMIAIMAFISQVVAHGIGAPLDRLVTFTKSIASGDRTARAPVSGGEEVRRLTESFNEMVDRLREYEEKLLQSEKLAVTGLLAAQIAHEIRNPLLSMKMEGQLLQTRLDPGTKSEGLIAAILREIDRVEWVVKGLLELARPGELRLVPASVNQCLGEVLDQTALQFQHREIDVVRNLETGLPQTLLDIDRFKQGLLNVILNAADAMTKGGCLTAVTSVGNGGASIIVEIVDDGTGIDPKIGNRLFDPFVSTKREGVGLGLVNAKGVVEKHRGTIELKPGPNGVGTRVIIELPIVSRDASGAADTNPREEIHG